MLSKLFRHTGECSRVLLSIFYLFSFILLFGVTIHVEASINLGSFISVDAGESHTCGMTTDGSVLCWGRNNYGQSSPPSGTFTQVSAGGWHSCGVKINGSVVCWGNNGENRATPPSGTFTQVSAGAWHSCGVKTDGSVACWGYGYNDYGQPTGTFTQVSAGTWHNCGVKTDGSVACWGEGSGRGQSIPPTGTFTQVSVGYFHTCGTRINGNVACWGDNQYDQSTPPTGTFTQVSAGTWHNCGVKTNGNVVCWGANDHGQATPPTGTFTQVSGGSYYSGSSEYFTDYTCGVKTNGSVVCWGDNQYGQSTSPSIVFPTLGTKPLTVTLDASSIVGSSMLNYQWYANNQFINAGNPANYTFTEHGEYIIKLVATHGDSSTSETLQNIRVMSPPMAKFTVSPLSGNTVKLDASASYDPDGSIISYKWAVNGQSIIGMMANTSLNNGDKVTLTVTDNEGLTANADSTQESSYILTVNKNGSGSGLVTGQGIDCDGNCSEQYDENTQVTLTAAPNSGSTFGGWSGACSGTASCQIMMDEAKSVTATFKEDGQPSNETHTLILTNRMKLAQLYGPTQAEQLMSKLNKLAENPHVQGLVIQVEDDSTVANAYAIRGDNYDNKNQANVVVVSIKQLIRRHWDTLGNQLENIMLIGDDRVIPFYRLEDGTFEPDPWTLTDDFYTDRNPSECPKCANPLVFIPDIAGGRLLETPAQIIGMIDAFLADNHLNIRSAAITGYDFIQDGAKAACDTLQRVNIPSDCSLIGESWDSEDFKGQILNRHHDITSINAHADYEMFLTPDDRYIWASDIAKTSTDFAGTLFYTVGCHSGLNVADKLDLPESFALKQANYIANTGYGIGGLDGIELSEELMWNLTKELVKSQTTLGKALLNAKQQYFADNPDFGPFDEKIVAESTLYGLPMYQVTSSATAKLSPAITAIKTQTTEEQGLQKAGYSYTWATATPTATTSGQKFYSLNGTMTSSSEGKPILPKLSYNVTQTQKALHGVVFRGGSYNTVNVTPPIQRFKTTTGHITPKRTFSAPGWYPSIFFTPNSIPLDTGDKETLVATAGQYNPNLTTGQQRIFSNMDFDVFHHANTNDWTKPTVYLTNSRLNANTATVTITTSDASDIKEVVLAYTDGNGTWNSINLTGSGVTWTGSFAAKANTEFFIQAVDKAGNVAVNENEGKYFKVGQTPPPSIATASLINISTRAPILGGANNVIAGFIIEGTGTQQIVLRGWGLEAGVDPMLTLQKQLSNGNWKIIAGNNNWQNGARYTAIPSQMTASFEANDAALLLDLAEGVYTVNLSSVAQTGRGLVGVDAIDSNQNIKLINLSTRAPIKGGADNVVAGFIITGGGTQKIVLRGWGLETGVNPKLTLQKQISNTQWKVIANNDNWQTDARHAEIPAYLTANFESNDAALLRDLQPGVYTVTLSSVGANGLGLVGVDALD